MGIVDDLNAVPRFAFHPFSRVKGRYIPPIFFSWISEKKKKKKKKSFDQLQSTLKKIQQRYVHVGENRRFKVIRRSYSYSLCSPRIPDCFPFQFLFLSTHYIRP